jgi:DoxX-like family
VVLPLLVSWQHPLLWFHPFGPMTKNLPILFGTLLVLRRCPR